MSVIDELIGNGFLKGKAKSSSRLNILQTLVDVIDDDDIELESTLQALSDTLNAFGYKSTLEAADMRRRMVAEEHVIACQMAEKEAQLRKESLTRAMIAEERGLLSRQSERLQALTTRERLYIDLGGRYSASKNFTNGMMGWNSTRLLFPRTEREIKSALMGPQFDKVKQGIGAANAGLTILGCAWYAPRLGRHTYCGVKNAANTGSLDYFSRHSFEMLNDAAWLGTGIVTLGISTHWYLAGLAATLGPGGIFLTVGLYGFDVLNACWKWRQEIKKMNQTLKVMRKEEAHLTKAIDRYLGELNIIESEIERLKELGANANRLKLNKRFVALNLDGLSPESNPECYHADVRDDMNRYLLNLYARKAELIKTLRPIVLMRDKVRRYQRRLHCKKKYMHAECKARVAVALGFVVAMGVSLMGPVGLLVGSSLVLGMCAVQYYVKKKYLPRKEVSTSHNAADLIHKKLLEHVNAQIGHLLKVREKLRAKRGLSEKESTLYSNTLYKLSRYRDMRCDLVRWRYTEQRDYARIPRLIHKTVEVSQLCRKNHSEPSSAQQLKELLLPFSHAPWSESPDKVVAACRSACVKKINRLKLSWSDRVNHFGGGGIKVRGVVPSASYDDLIKYSPMRAPQMPSFGS